MAALVAFPGEGRSIAFVDSHEVFTPIVIVPGEGSLDRCPGHPGAFQEVQGRTHYSMLHRDVPRFANGIAEREIGENEACDPDFFDNVPRTAHDNCREAIFFQMTGDQTHGLVAHRSKSGQENGIEAVFATPIENLRRVSLQRSYLAVIRRHAIEAGRS